MTQTRNNNNNNQSGEPLSYHVAQSHKRASTVFYKHQLENASFVLYLFDTACDDNNAGAIIAPALFDRLKTAKEGMVYPQKKRPRQDMTDEEKAKYLSDVLKKIIKQEFFGNPVYPPLHDTVSFDKLTIRLLGEHRWNEFIAL